MTDANLVNSGILVSIQPSKDLTRRECDGLLELISGRIKQASDDFARRTGASLLVKYFNWDAEIRDWIGGAEAELPGDSDADMSRHDRRSFDASRQHVVPTEGPSAESISRPYPFDQQALWGPDPGDASTLQFQDNLNYGQDTDPNHGDFGHPFIASTLLPSNHDPSVPQPSTPNMSSYPLLPPQPASVLPSTASNAPSNQQNTPYEAAANIPGVRPTMTQQQPPLRWRATVSPTNYLDPEGARSSRSRASSRRRNHRNNPS